MFEINSYTFDWKLFWLMVFLAIPGMFFGTTAFIRTYWHYIKTHYPYFKKINIVIGFLILNFILITGSIVTGILVSATTNARFIYFMALMNQKNLLPAFLFEFLSALFTAFPAALVFLLFYYYIFRPYLDEKSLFIIEKMRNHLGLNARIFYNSIIGEIIFRWGLQSLIIWIVIQFIDFGTLAIIIGILLTSSFYGMIHLLNLRFVKIKKSRGIALRAWLLYFFSSVIFGVVFWKFGILSSMITHAIFHIIWYPLDIFYYRKFPED